MLHKLTAENAGVRLDNFLAEKLEMSRSQVKRAVDEGRVAVNGQKVKAGYKLQAEDEISFEEEAPYVLEPKDVAFKVLYEDEHLACIDKPYGLVVHPGAGREEETLVHGLLYRFDYLAEGSDPLRPGIVHRLDKDTSGVMVVAKTDTAYDGLVDAFQNRRVEKIYYAICRGVIREAGMIDSPIGRDPKNRIRMAAGVYPSKEALTEYAPVLAFRDSTLIRVALHTGRTHQIRVHMASIGHALLGDPLYGAKNDREKELLLHSCHLAFTHPITGDEVAVTSKLPERMLAYIRKEKGDRCTRF